MECSQDLLQLDNEIGRINFMRDTDSSLPVLPSLDILEDFLENGLNTPRVTPLHFPHGFIKEERELFSSPPVVSSPSIQSEVKPSLQALNETLDRSNPKPHIPVKEKKREAIKRRALCPKSLPFSSKKQLVRKRIQPKTGLIPLVTELGPTVWHPPPLMQIISHPTPDLVKRFTTSHMPYVNPLRSQIPRK